MNLAKLFEPGKIGTMELKNRIIMAPMGTFSTDAKGYPTSRTIDFYVERAKGGVGFIITGGCSVIPEARVPGMLWIYDDKFIPRLKELSQAVHKHGAKIAIQLNHLGKVLSDVSLSLGKGDVVSASAVPWIENNFVPREASKKDINYFVRNFAEAGLRAKKAGFDAVEIHGGHGYLIHGFLSPFTNKRTDEYGGNAEKRARFACEIIESLREGVGPNFPITLRLSASEYIEGGITLKDTLCRVPLFIEAGADALHISASGSETTERQILSYLYPDGALVPLAETVKKAVNVPVIAVGKIGDPVLANRILEEGKADFVAMGRALMADADLPNKAKEGKFEDIRQCIYCNNCWAKPREERRKFGGLFCTVNPALFREREFTLRRATLPKKVMVVGGGLAGMEAARVLAERGHLVSLFEKGDKLGGQWNIASQQEFKDQYSSVTERMYQGLIQTGVKVTLNKQVTRQFVRGRKPDVVVVATGAVPATLDIPGVQGKNVVQANNVITGKAKVGERVIVLGGRLIGMEVALLLAKGAKKVSLVTLHRLGENGRKIDVNIHRTLIRRLVDSGVYIYPNSPAIEIRDDGVQIDYDHNLVFLKADTIVMAVGAEPEKRLIGELKEVVSEVYSIGDCVEPRDAMEAIREGAELGRRI